MPQLKESCTNRSPPWFVGHWRDWHRGHGCDLDDGKPRSEAARTEIVQHAANAGTGYLTDAELRHLRASTTAGNDLLVRALDELAERRAENARLAAELRRVCQRIVAEGKVNAAFAEASGEALAKQLNAQEESPKKTTPSFDHSARTTKHFEPLLGYCVCAHCAKLPAPPEED